MSKFEIPMFNFKTGELEFGASMPETDEEAKCLIPQTTSALLFYELLRECKGVPILVALQRVLEVSAGK